MLSVQTAGCAGMERLGVPTRTTLNTPPDDRDQYICRMHIDAAREFLGVCSEPVIRGGSSSRHQQQQQNHHNIRDQTHHLHQHHQQLVVHRMATSSTSASSSASASATTSASSSSSASASASPLLPSGNNSISNNNSNNINNNSNNYNNNIPSMTNNTIGSSAIVTKGGFESTPLKYGNSGSSGSSGNGSGDTSGSSNSSGSQCSVNSHSHDHHQHYQHQLQQQKTLCCPHHVPLPDSEWIPTDQRPVQLRSSYQHSELTRSYIKPPPNKTVKDVPDRSSYNFYSSTAHSSSSGLHSLASTQWLANSYSSSSNSSSSSSSSGTHSKSKANVITKFFNRKSSPKSPNNVTSSPAAASGTSFSSSALPSLYSTLSSSSSIASSALSLLTSASSAGSTSSSMSSNSQTSSASSMAAVPLTTLPISIAATLKTTPCDCGPNMQQTPGLSVSHISVGLVPSTQLLTTIGVSHPTATTTFPHTSSMPTGMEQRIPTPPLSVCVPINPAYQQQQKQHQQQLLLDCLVGDCASVSSTLQTIKSSSCSPTLSATTTNTPNAGKDDVQHMECQSGNITRNNSSSSMHSLTATTCNCQKPNCKHCTNDAATLPQSLASSSASLSS